MTHLPRRLATIALLAGAFAAPSCFAESSIASLASDSLSRSSASISDSITGSSHASSPDNKQVQGEYKVTGIVVADARPGMLQLRLQPMAAGATADDQIVLTLPREAAADGRVALDTVVTAKQRPYGIEFASDRTKAAFFLALADDWARDLKAAPLTL